MRGERPPAAVRSPAVRPNRARLIPLILVAWTLVVYAGVLGNGFVDYDDDSYVTRNRTVLAGLTRDGVVWALTTGHAGNWHPLTWLSHMADVELWGRDPAGHHLTSLLLHAANAVLLFLALQRMTGAVAKSALVALLFAIHPLHVESVAWVSERKDLLSGSFFLLALLAYGRYVDRPGIARYAGVALCFALGLLAKPMIVTLPAVLLVLDAWPFRRLDRGSAVRRVAEKLPLFALALASAAVTFLAQSRGGAVSTLAGLPLATRAGNALVSYLAYLADTLWPVRLAAFYPYPRGSLALPAAAAAAVLGAITLAALALRSRRPYLLAGWLWYLGMLVPVIGLVQVGEQARADRYTYLPLVGVFAMLVWGVADILPRTRSGRIALAAATAVVLATLSWLTRAQVATWRDTAALFGRALAVTEGNHAAHFGLGFALARQDKSMLAMAHYREALRLRPDFADARISLAVELAKAGRIAEAEVHGRLALRVRPDDAEGRANLGSVLYQQGRLVEALAEYQRAVALDREGPEVRYNLGLALAALGRRDEAIAAWREAVRLDPSYAPARRALERAR